MTAKPILYEAQNLTLRAGTGIATYARILTETARSLGYRTDALIATTSKIDARDPLLNEIHLSDAARSVSFSDLRWRDYHWAVGAPFGIKAVGVRKTGAVVEPPNAMLNGFDTIYASAHMFDIAESHFNRHGKCAVVRMPETPGIFHATRVVPISVPNCPNIYTIHDIVPLRLPYATLENKKYMLNLTREICRKADHIVTVSEFSRQDIISMFGIDEDRITNTYQCVEFPAALLDRSEDEIADELRLTWNLEYKDYFLFVGAIEPKKNISRLLSAYVQANVGHPLVLAGGLGWQYDRDLEAIEDERFKRFRLKGDTMTIERQVRRVPHVPLKQLVSLIRGARALLFPSVYEGFGIPVLEAMMLGTPVLTSNVSSLPEIAGGAALLVDPTDIDDIARGIRTLANDADLRRDLAQKGLARAEAFSPARYKERIKDLYGRILGHSPAKAD